MTSIAWFRRDLRLGANPILDDDRLVPLFVVDPALPRRGPRWDELVARLHGLDRAIAARGGRLRVEVGDPAEVVPAVASEVGADQVLANADVSAFARDRDDRVGRKVPLSLTWATHVHRPGSVTKGDGSDYRVFTPYHRTWAGLPVAVPVEATPAMSDEVGVGLPPLGDRPARGETEAWAAVERWLAGDADQYADGRDRIDRAVTSHLSVDLKFGTLSVAALARAAGSARPGTAEFVRQLAWRDFWAQRMWFEPTATGDPVHWQDDPDGLAAWQEGRTGVPIVDAGMRQLVTDGWMHGRLRMIAASYLVKHLLVDWRLGEAFFRHHLRDGDPPQNVGNWRWVAGVGPGTAPWHRVMNPVLQARRYDPDGDHVRRWVPELASIPGPDVHAPWELGPLERGTLDYPDPVVELAAGRERALAAR